MRYVVGVMFFHIYIVQPFMSGTFIAANGGKVEMDKNLRANVGQFVPSLRIAICTRVNERAPNSSSLQTANHKIFMELSRIYPTRCFLIRFFGAITT